LANPPLTTLEASRRQVREARDHAQREVSVNLRTTEDVIRTRAKSSLAFLDCARASHALPFRPLSVVARFAHLPTRGFERR
jgi:hypothetical protein